MEVGVEGYDNRVSLLRCAENGAIVGCAEADGADMGGRDSGPCQKRDGGTGKALIKQELHGAEIRSMVLSSRLAAA